jgi:ubiquitin-protein ligase
MPLKKTFHSTMDEPAKAISKLRPKLRQSALLKPKIKPQLKPLMASLPKALAEDDDIDDPMSMPLPGFNVTMKAHKTKKPSKALAVGIYIPMPRLIAYKPSNVPWYRSSIMSIRSGDRRCRGETIPIQIPSPSPSPRPSLTSTGVVFNVYKPTTEERDLFSETMSDQVYFTDNTVRGGGNTGLNSALTVMKHMKQFRRQLLPYWESSIYVRGNDEDMTSYQFVIAGPRDTPYDNGLFLYYMKLPTDYPTHPPTITIGSTDKGRFRINPNLYSGGKVCLDLLGTFGNSWTHNSNTVQVLLAIQAQIMVELPLKNEPGYSNDHGVNNVIYNALLRIVTMRVGMIDPMLQPYSAFSDLIDKFFYGPKRMEIVTQMYVWVQAAKEITVSQCQQFVDGFGYCYMAGGGDGAGGGIGLLPSSVSIHPDQLREGIVMLTTSHAGRVLNLLNADCPVW